jgi:hypothetical protein
MERNHTSITYRFQRITGFLWEWTWKPKLLNSRQDLILNWNCSAAMCLPAQGQFSHDEFLQKSKYVSFENPTMSLKLLDRLLFAINRLMTPSFVFGEYEWGLIKSSWWVPLIVLAQMELHGCSQCWFDLPRKLSLVLASKGNPRAMLQKHYCQSRGLRKLLSLLTPFPQQNL